MTILIGLTLAVITAQLSATPVLETPNLTVVKANGVFAKNMYKEFTTKEENILFSPISAHAVLSLAYQGAGGETRDAFAKVLNVPEEAVAAEGYNLVLGELNSIENVTLLMANKAYVMKNYELQKNFNKVATEKFLSTVETVNFADNVKTAGIINQWVEEKTHNKIKDLTEPESLTGDTRLVLVNAIYFKGLWASKFDPKQTQKKPFYINGDNQVEVDMMHQTGELRYKDDPELKAKILELPYTNEDISLVVILPNERTGIKKLEEKVLNGNLANIVENMVFHRVNVHLPKFKIETKIDLKDVLTKMGLGIIFKSNADFSKLITGGEQLVVSKVIQKAFMEVNEEGAEAAAATEVIFMTRTAKVLPSAEFNAEHPFLFSLIHRQHGTPNLLFSGKYVIPTH